MKRKDMQSREIRGLFLDFFRNKGHKVTESDLLVPRNDPTLLFTGAGMNQFKEQFMGKNVTFSRAASSQKCLRTGDLENVGRTPRHHTFFEMLGNFSFGDYFKKEAIEWAWEFMTSELGIPAEKLWVSVYKDDDEAYDIWTRTVSLPAERVIRLGEHDNFWPADAPSMGPNGPCGPCSEIFFDQGEKMGCGAGCAKDPSCGCDRFLEVWNLVFTQFDRQPDGRLEPLPSRNIDTGMGLERIAAVVQGVDTNFKTDLFVPIIEEIIKSLPRGSKKMPEESLNMIADHIRAVVFAIADGVSPSNERRGYVVRKLIRRAFLKSGSAEPFLFNLVPRVVSVMRDAYPYLEEKREHIAAIIKEEEARFSSTLEAAMPVMEQMLSGGSKALNGGQIFKLVDTYGLPVDIIQDEAADRGFSLDLEGFERKMSERKEQSRKGSNITSDFIFKPDKFSGVPRPDYSDRLPLETSIEFILKGDSPSEDILEGERGEVITSPQSSRLYAEAGGQVGDSGTITRGDALLRVVDTFETDGKKVMQVVAEKGSFKKGDRVSLDIDRQKKQRTARNHTATHLLQAALREVLGEHVKQSGSHVDDKRLRFDFSHMKKLSDREMIKIEGLVNGWIGKGIEVCKEVKGIEEARKEGALSFFGEKYGDTVRVVSIGGESKEFCGGTHVDNTADIGAVKIINESSVASGIRRIEAVTSDSVSEWMKGFAESAAEDASSAGADLREYLPPEISEKLDDMLSGNYRATPRTVHEFEDKVKPAILDAVNSIRKEARKKQKKKASDSFNEIRSILDSALGSPEKIAGVDAFCATLRGADMGAMRKAAAYIEKKVDSGVILLGGIKEGKACVICAVTEDLVPRGFDARQVINGIAAEINGGGGGKPNFAQAGGKDPSGLEKAMEKGKRILGERIGKSSKKGRS
ncbi:MAG: alanine--tRNA ligase [Candidatus Omnitrophica bacterium]|nr:alanine--tRNA ligase [Candidatus Omnitrophota bacterium]